MALAEETVIASTIGIIALILFAGGLLLVFSIKPREYKSATWMSGIAFYLLWNSMEGIKTSEISFLNAINILELTAIAFTLIGIFEKRPAKKYIWITFAFLYIVLVILSH